MSWLDGSVDAGSARRLRCVLERAISDGIDHLIIDLASVTHLSTSGVRVLVDVQARLAPHGALTLRCPSAEVIETLERCGALPLINHLEEHALTG